MVCGVWDENICSVGLVDVLNLFSGWNEKSLFEKLQKLIRQLYAVFKHLKIKESSILKVQKTNFIIENHFYVNRV